MADNDWVIVGVRANVPVVAPGTKFSYTCYECGEKVGLAPSGVKKAAERKARVICHECMLKQIEKEGIDKIELPTREELLRDLLGSSDN